MQRRRAEVAIIGAGPAGIAAAQQCVRQGITDVSLMERERPGGLIYHANLLENFPGLRGMSGREAAVELVEMLDDEIHISACNVTDISMKEGSFVVKAADGPVTISDHVILATGTEPKKLGIPGEIAAPEWRDHSGERSLILGGGDAAYDYALRLHELGADVTILRRSEPKALKVLVDRARAEGIKEVYGEPGDVVSFDGSYNVKVGDKITNYDNVITAIGRVPTYPRVAFEHSEPTFPSGATSVEGFYMVGSLVLGNYRQATLAWGMGLASAMDIAGKKQ